MIVRPISLCACACVATLCADELDVGFRDPPARARSQTWYHLMNGNVTTNGITRDFEELARVGIGGVQMFDAGCWMPRGNLAFNTPDWFRMIRHSASEARRLGLELCLPNCSGWSSSGGPWNQPSNAMKTLTFRQLRTRGPTKLQTKLPRETNDNGFYADIGVFAFPTPAADLVDLSDVVTTVETNGFTCTSSQPFPVRGISFRLQYDWSWMETADISVDTSADGVNFRSLEVFTVNLARNGQCDYTLRYHAFPEKLIVRAVRVRIVRADLKVTVCEARPEMSIRLSGLAAKTYATRQETICDTVRAAKDQVVRLCDVRDLSSRMKPDGTFAWDVPPGDWTILRLGFACNGRCNHPASVGGCGLEVDKLSSEAMDRHFESYIGVVCGELGPLAGKVATGFNNVLVDSFEVGSQNWTQRMEPEFIRRCGYGIRSYLPVFAGYIVDSVATTERFLEDFRRVTSDLFAKNYAGALTRNCHKRGLSCSIEPSGNCPSDNLQYGAYCDIPMGECWSHAGDPYNLDCGNSKFASCVAHVWGKRICAMEAFTARPGPDSGRWLTTPFSLKAQGDRAYANGANRMIYHRYVHQPWPGDDYLPGMTMGRWGMHFDRTQTWWPYVGPFLRYQARCQFMQQEGIPYADVLYFAGEEAPNQGFPQTEEPALALPFGYDFDVCPKIALSRIRVENGCVIVPGGVRYRIFALPSREAVSLEVVELVTEMVAKGVPIVWPKRPVRAFGLRGGAMADKKVCQKVKSLWSTGKVMASVSEAIAKISLAPDVKIELGSVQGIEGLSCNHRCSDSADWYFVAMPNRTESTVELSFRQVGRIPELWDAESGTCETASTWRCDGVRTHVSVPFSVCGSKFIVFRTPTTETASRPSERPSSPRAIPVSGPWTVSFPNSYLPNPLARGREERLTFARLVSWSEHPDVGVRYFSGTAKYERTLERPTCAPGSRIELDLGEVKEVSEVFVGDRTVAVLWKPPFRVDLTEAFRTNDSIRISVRVANLWANRLIGDERQHGDDCRWEERVDEGRRELGLGEIPEWVKTGNRSPTGRCTFTTWKHWTKEDSLLPSGLLGPVTLRVSQR